MATAMTTAGLMGLVASVGAMSPAADDAERIARIRHFEELKAAICAAQAAVAVDFDCSQRRARTDDGVPAARRGQGVAAQVALARRVSPWQAQRWLGWAKILTTELPATYSQLKAGHTTEWRAMLIARETAVLSREHRAAVDSELGAHLEGWGDRKVEGEARKAVYRLDPAGAVERASNAEADRRVGIRPAPDTMSWLSALLPVAQGVAAYAALKREADRLIGIGDGRNRGQIMADTIVERITGQASAADVGVEINLIMTDHALFRGSTTRRDEPAWVEGYGPVPAQWARDLAHGRHDARQADDSPTAPRWIRRLYTRSGRLIALDSRRRLFTAGQQRFLRLRDQTCRTPWCDAPIRHADHLRPAVKNGRTHVDNGQGLCEACNYAREARGWHAEVGEGGVIVIRTPTGHLYPGVPPNITGPPSRSPVDQQLRAYLAA